MRNIDSNQTQQHRLRNSLHSVLILTVMVLLLGFAIESVLGSYGWWFVGILLIFILLGQGYSPRIIMNMYQAKVINPSNAPDLYQAMGILSQRAKLTVLPRLYYIPSPMVTAFTMGRGNDYVIALSDGLLRRLNLRQLAGVMAHEISHIAHHDIPVLTLADFISRTTSLIAVIGTFAIIILSPFLLFSEQGIPWLALFILLITPNIMPLLQLALSRTRELAADIGAVELTGDPQSMITALQKIEQPQQSWLAQLLFPERRDSVPSLLRSHPPTSERIQLLQKLTVNNPPISVHEQDIAPRWVIVTRKPRRHWSGFWY